MKHHLALIALFTLAVCCLGQGTARGQITPPQEVKQNFYSHFEDANSTSWSKENAHYFAHFKQGGMNMKAKYTLTGKWVSTDIFDIPPSKLPGNTVRYLDEKHAGYSIREIFFHDEAGGNSYYRIKLNQGGKPLYFHDSGSFWK